MIDVLAGPAGLTRGGQPIRVCLLCTQGRRTDVLHERAHRYRRDPEARADGVVDDVVRRLVLSKQCRHSYWYWYWRQLFRLLFRPSTAM